MSVKSPKKTVRLFRLLLGNFIEMNYKLILLANKIDRNYFEEKSRGYYSDTGPYGETQSRRHGFIKTKTGIEPIIGHLKKISYAQIFTN